MNHNCKLRLLNLLFYGNPHILIDKIYKQFYPNSYGQQNLRSIVGCSFSININTVTFKTNVFLLEPKQSKDISQQLWKVDIKKSQQCDFILDSKITISITTHLNTFEQIPLGTCLIHVNDKEIKKYDGISYYKIYPCFWNGQQIAQLKIKMKIKPNKIANNINLVFEKIANICQSQKKTISAISTSKDIYIIAEKDQTYDISSTSSKNRYYVPQLMQLPQQTYKKQQNLDRSKEKTHEQQISLSKKFDKISLAIQNKQIRKMEQLTKQISKQEDLNEEAQNQQSVQYFSFQSQQNGSSSNNETFFSIKQEQNQQSEWSRKNSNLQI